MNERHEELSTADLADQRPRDVERPDDRTPGDTDLADERADAQASAPEMPEMGPDGEADRERPRDGVEPAGSATLDDADTATGPLLGSGDAEGFRARWTDVQTGFVDAPREAVERADGLVAEVMQHLAKTFADERSRLERQWDRGDDVPTDDLRTAFQRYRSFFERLLST
jgi:hypothetical protein